MTGREGLGGTVWARVVCGGDGWGWDWIWWRGGGKGVRKEGGRWEVREGRRGERKGG